MQYTIVTLDNNTIITVYATGGINNFVEVAFDSSTQSINCLFLTDSPNEKYCTVNVTYGSKCDQPVGVYPGKGTSNSVDTPQIPLNDDASEYCLFVNATDNNMTVIVEERLNIGIMVHI